MLAAERRFGGSENVEELVEASDAAAYASCHGKSESAISVTSSATFWAIFSARLGERQLEGV